MKNIIKISEYPDKITPRLRKLAIWINKNQNKIKADLAIGKYDVFDYNHYWGAPKTLTRNLTTDEVDFLQVQTDNFYLQYKKDCY